MNTEDFLNVAKELARKAGDLCLELQNNLGDVRYKTVKDVVTIADVSSEKLIVDGLRADPDTFHPHRRSGHHRRLRSALPLDYRPG